MTALLQVFYEDIDGKVVKYAKVARDMGFEVFPPSINHSGVGFTIEGNRGIRFGLGSIKGLGEATLDIILNNRDDSGIYSSIDDILSRIKLNKKALNALCFSGAFDFFLSGTSLNRFDFMAHINEIRGEGVEPEVAAAIAKYSDRLKFEKEREFLGMYVSGHVLDRLAEPTNWDDLDDATHYTMVSLNEVRVIRTKRGQDMAFLKVDTLEGERDLTLFPNQFATVENSLIPGMIFKVGIKASMNWTRNQRDYIVQSISAPKKINKDLIMKVEKQEEEDFMQGA